MDNSRSRKQRRRPKGVTAMVQAHAQLPSPVAIHGIEANLGAAPADTFLHERYRDVEADFVRSGTNDE